MRDEPSDYDVEFDLSFDDRLSEREREREREIIVYFENEQDNRNATHKLII